MFSSRRWRALALGCALAACGTTAGDDPHAGMASVSGAEGRWRLWYTAPPWSLVERGADRAVLRVASTGDAVLMGGAAGAIVALVAEPVAGSDPGAWVRAQYDAALGRGAVARYLPRVARYQGAALPFTEASVTTYDGTTRWAARALPGGRVLTLTFTAPADISDDPDLAQIIAAVDAGGAP